MMRVLKLRMLKEIKQTCSIHKKDAGGVDAGTPKKPRYVQIIFSSYTCPDFHPVYSSWQP